MCISPSGRNSRFFAAEERPVGNDTGGSRAVHKLRITDGVGLGSPYRGHQRRSRCEWRDRRSTIPPRLDRSTHHSGENQFARLRPGHHFMHYVGVHYVSLLGGQLAQAVSLHKLSQGGEQGLTFDSSLRPCRVINSFTSRRSPSLDAAPRVIPITFASTPGDIWSRQYIWRSTTHSATVTPLATSLRAKACDTWLTRSAAGIRMALQLAHRRFPSFGPAHNDNILGNGFLVDYLDLRRA
jgi:hypothetical protein